MDLEDVCRDLGIAESTWHRWVVQYGGMKANDAKRLKYLRAKGVSQRRACRLVGQHRSTQRLDPPEITDEEQQLRWFLRSFSKRRPRSE